MNTFNVGILAHSSMSLNAGICIGDISHKKYGDKRISPIKGEK